MANPNAHIAQNYLRTKVFTATPEQLQLMLYDGAIRFGEQAKAALELKNFEQSYNLISRVQKILTELSCTLKHDVAPELCGKLAALYNFVYRKLIEANVEHTTAPLEAGATVDTDCGPTDGCTSDCWTAGCNTSETCENQMCVTPANRS